ncbi:hypothetical protein DRQ09_06005 [candidate division KSB1 bacterium]|nr:MAG: hypothetical protein DRQ09_06005 [candidate division KSB1 bacterium]
MSTKNENREYIGIIFKCCNIYNRIYLNKEKTSFVGWCPRCGKKVEVKVSPYGSTSRFFEVS